MNSALPMATWRPSTTPDTPRPVCDANDVAVRISPCRFRACAAIASPSGCSLDASTDAALIKPLLALDAATYLPAQGSGSEVRIVLVAATRGPTTVLVRAVSLWSGDVKYAPLGVVDGRAFDVALNTFRWKAS